ncbi:UDP-N-acetylmuramoyl-L-alanine--D-glutamate ligase [Corynebacterium pseudodiphtheriticum]|uniref:UDP-N-acetylmuramoyl-L-alanine--D-glutamate ligase n=1 Tax=Corynebacterium pseudodiphtheriticum TaxID=37637 RepID=UPI001EF59C1A|nr:UDP-N-acetylmuramoyl-L-alanine--D-glutamate ligase [Corynebacterium pseudodiphtheriticum]MCG7251773.1 UDP-N-acetylmuramoyl-L-alanine--D-glutamate ligase [Corynebacterium pseudodiphtheriticum]MDK4339906.1 UDP-N-acetylmuramoyl-L-alanine--D-glutamate ligase [Corynebacterium pseudodiphtheriticum]
MKTQLKRVLVAGAGVSGAGCARALVQLGADVIIADNNLAAASALAEELKQFLTLDKGVHGSADRAPRVIPVAATAVDFEDDRELAALDLVVTSPGWPPHAPLLIAAKRAGLEVIGDVELGFRLDRAGVYGPCRDWLVVTGTNGKTTTTGMLSSIMDAHGARVGKRAMATGNIGASVFEALAARPRVDIVVLEASSFQLHWAPTLIPDVGVLLNIADDHIDWHGSFAAYAADKATVLRAAKRVVGIDDAVARRISDERDAAAEDGGTGTTRGFTQYAPITGQVGVRDRALVLAEEALVGEGLDSENAQESTMTELAQIEGLQPPGAAGILDAGAAAAAAYDYGVAPHDIAAGLARYRVAAHRGAVVATIAGIDYIDNSKATNPHAAQAAMAGLESIIWVAGGQLKGASVEELVRAEAHRLKAVVLIGVDRHAIAETLHRQAPGIPVELISEQDPQRCMDLAVAAAHKQASAGDTVLLAPAAASLDMFSGMAQRGDLFARATSDYSG